MFSKSSHLPVIAWLLVALTAAAAWSPAQANTLYRCTGAQGEAVYSTDRSGYTDCKSLGNYPAAAAPKPTASTAASIEKRVDFRTAPSGSEPSKPPAASGAKVTRGAVYRYEKDGITHYTNRSPGRAANAKLLFSYIETCYACGAAPGVDWAQVALNLTSYSSEVAAAAELAGVDPALVRAIMHAESAFNPLAKSHVGAQGLMQLMPDTATRFGVSDAWEPTQNISGGTQYLAWLMNRFNNDITRVAAAYNAGEGAVDRHGGVPPYEETQRFVERVGILFSRYHAALAAGGSAASGLSSSAR